MRKMLLSTMVGMVFLISCSLDSDEFRGPVDSKIKITMLDLIGSEKTTFQFLFETQKTYECANYLILMEATGDDKTVNFTFNEIYKDFSCVSEVSSASNEYRYAKLDKGVYDVSFKVKDKTAVNGKLTVSDSSYALEVGQSPDFEFVNTLLYKMPAGTVWGSIQRYTENQQSADLVEDFFELLGSSGLADTTYAQGDYTYFLVDDKEKVSLRRTSAVPAGTTVFLYFMDETKVNRNNLRTAIGDFRGIYSQYVKVDVFDWKGTVY